MRMFTHIIIGLTKEDKDNITENEYIRLLGFSINGQKHLNSIKKTLTIPIITNYKKNISSLLDLELRAASIYYLPISNTLFEKEFQSPTIKNKQNT